MTSMTFIYKKIQTILKEFDLDMIVTDEREDWYIEFRINGYKRSYFRIYQSARSGKITLTNNQLSVSYNSSDNYYNKLAEDLIIYLINYIL